MGEVITSSQSKLSPSSQEGMGEVITSSQSKLPPSSQEGMGEVIQKRGAPENKEKHKKCRCHDDTGIFL